MKISKIIMRPKYALYKHGAPIKRNEKMVETCDRALVFWDGVSSGTKYTIDYVKKIGKPIDIIIEN